MILTVAGEAFLVLPPVLGEGRRRSSANSALHHHWNYKGQGSLWLYLYITDFKFMGPDGVSEKRARIILEIF